MLHEQSFAGSVYDSRLSPNDLQVQVSIILSLT